MSACLLYFFKLPAEVHVHRYVRSMPACSGAGKALAAMMAGDKAEGAVHEFVLTAMAPARLATVEASAKL